ncbi:uncharacterized protein LOC131606976 [Vicia villosa]|uniref:uncharacterized protein LOC131606976 n=1 Tax=Vicia villosa TaxID=3911 RepID=UPI00273C3379|nr:uncharacterized protein LOC131606976 [Vicia villosa]XP_058735029.1 uncharacterized protein LOC131606976 [Vicia villosa]XP_058735031.1 uncharacterized protein LOC131606976 [Vicia villosa]
MASKQGVKSKRFGSIGTEATNSPSSTTSSSKQFQKTSNDAPSSPASSSVISKSCQFYPETVPMEALKTKENVTVTVCFRPLNEIMGHDILDIHKGENFPQRIVTCEFCEFSLPAIDLAEHQEVCGNQIGMCHLCNKYVRLRERYIHEVNCNRLEGNVAGSSRDERPAERDAAYAIYNLKCGFYFAERSNAMRALKNNERYELEVTL